MKQLRTSLTLSATTALLLTANLVLAQDQPRPEQKRGDAPAGERRPEGSPERRPEGGGQFRGGPGGPGGMPMIEFTEEQRDAMRTAMEDRREEFGQLNEKMRDARMGLQKEILAEKQNADRIKSFAKEVAELQAEMTVIQAKAFAQARPKFTAEQLEKLKNSPMGMEFLMRGGMQGRGGPGEGRRPGDDAPGARPEGKNSDSPRPGRPRPDAESK